MTNQNIASSLIQTNWEEKIICTVKCQLFVSSINGSQIKDMTSNMVFQQNITIEIFPVLVSSRAPIASLLGQSCWVDLTYCGAGKRMSRGSGNPQQLLPLYNPSLKHQETTNAPINWNCIHLVHLYM